MKGERPSMKQGTYYKLLDIAAAMDKESIYVRSIIKEVIIDEDTSQIQFLKSCHEKRISSFKKKLKERKCYYLTEEQALAYSQKDNLFEIDVTLLSTQPA